MEIFNRPICGNLRLRKLDVRYLIVTCSAAEAVRHFLQSYLIDY